MRITRDKVKLERIINHFGNTKQIYVAIEEMSELTKALTKSLRDRYDIKSILEEMADVELCMRELRIIYNINQEDVEEVIQQKIQRTLKRIDTEKLKEAYKNARAVD